MRLLAAVTLAIAGFASTACGPPDPETLYVELGCPRCHGFELQGNRYGPALDRLDRTWESEEKMTAYLRDPQTMIETDPRLKLQDADYELKMQPVSNSSDQDLAILSAWLVSSE